MITKKEMEQWAMRHGYSKDKYNHYRKIVDGKDYRLKLSNIMARMERKLCFNETNEWMRLRSGYYKNIAITPEDKLVGLK